ncbi:MAG: hypothetical protein ACYDC1_25190 [Limisphaerales bacterium]
MKYTLILQAQNESGTLYEGLHHATGGGFTVAPMSLRRVNGREMYVAVDHRPVTPQAAWEWFVRMAAARCFIIHGPRWRWWLRTLTVAMFGEAVRQKHGPRFNACLPK